MNVAKPLECLSISTADFKLKIADFRNLFAATEIATSDRVYFGRYLLPAFYVFPPDHVSLYSFNN